MICCPPSPDRCIRLQRIFGFPFGSYATDGNESLSLVLYSYSQLRRAPCQEVLFVLAEGEPPPPSDWIDCAARLGMRASEVEDGALVDTPTDDVIVVVLRWESRALRTASDWARWRRLPVHLHVSDDEWRHVFSEHPEPVHYSLPEAVRSMSIEHGLLRCGYQLYRDQRLRDLHIDLSYQWQTLHASLTEVLKPMILPPNHMFLPSNLMVHAFCPFALAPPSNAPDPTPPPSPLPPPCCPHSHAP